MVVDDEPAVVTIHHVMLEQQGFIVRQSYSGPELFASLEKEKPDLIILDVMMPEMDGLEAARRIRENPHTHAIPIIAVTALSSRKDKKKCLESGCDDYLSKPFTASQLSSSITRLLKQDST